MDDAAPIRPNSKRSTQPPSNPQSTKLELAGIVARLLSHYFAPSELDDAARKAMAADWLEDLAEYHPADVADACREWRRKPNGRRPLPGDIRALCIEHQRNRQQRMAIAGPSDMDAYARSVGFKNNAERMAEIEAVQQKLNSPVNFERLHKLAQDRTSQRVASLRPVREYSQEELRRARIALGIETQQQAAE